jgi:hypothetical protein
VLSVPRSPLAGLRGSSNTGGRQLSSAGPSGDNEHALAGLGVLSVPRSPLAGRRGNGSSSNAGGFQLSSPRSRGPSGDEAPAATARPAAASWARRVNSSGGGAPLFQLSSAGPSCDVDDARTSLGVRGRMSRAGTSRDVDEAPERTSLGLLAKLASQTSLGVLAHARSLPWQGAGLGVAALHGGGAAGAAPRGGPADEYIMTRAAGTITQQHCKQVLVDPRV